MGKGVAGFLRKVPRPTLPQVGGAPKNIITEGWLHIINIYKKKGLIHGYGASTKGNVLLQYFKLDRKTIKCIADRNPFKWGKYTPGTNIKIISEKTSRLQKPKLYIVLPWHFKNEIIKREKIFLKNKGTLFFPLPKCEIIKMDKKWSRRFFPRKYYTILNPDLEAKLWSILFIYYLFYWGLKVFIKIYIITNMRVFNLFS